MTDETKMILDEIGKLKQDIKEIQLTLENVTNKNIQIIAEGHLDLSRKLDDALNIAYCCDIVAPCPECFGVHDLCTQPLRLSQHLYISTTSE